MSQSDYIKYKRTGILLKDLKDQPSVLNPQLYTELINYNLENTINNSKIAYNKLVVPNKGNANIKTVFDMERYNTATCPTFPYCMNTNLRVNRKPLLRSQMSPRPVPKYAKDPINYKTHYTIKCICKDSKCKCTAVCGCAPTPTKYKLCGI